MTYGSIPLRPSLVHLTFFQCIYITVGSFAVKVPLFSFFLSISLLQLFHSWFFSSPFYCFQLSWILYTRNVQEQDFFLIIDNVDISTKDAYCETNKYPYSLIEKLLYKKQKRTKSDPDCIILKKKKSTLF